MFLEILTHILGSLSKLQLISAVQRQQMLRTASNTNTKTMLRQLYHNKITYFVPAAPISLENGSLEHVVEQSKIILKSQTIAEYKNKQKIRHG